MEQPLSPQIPVHYKVGFHEEPLMTSWLLLANLTLLVGVIKWHKYSFYLHAFLGLMIICLTLAGTLHVLFQVGIYYKPTKRFQLIHNIGGLIVVIWLSIQLLTGIISRTIQYSGKTSPNFCKWTKRIHQYSSYLVMMLAKFQYLIISYRRNKWSDILINLSIDIVFITLYLWLKFGYWRLEESVRDGQMINYGNEMGESNSTGFFNLIWIGIKSKIRQIRAEYQTKSLEVPQTKYLAVVYQSQKQIPIQQYVLFNEYVYDISPLNQVHPGGQQVIQQIKNRQVDRYLYGFYPSQMNESMVIHKHTKDSLRICGQPIARIERQSPIEGFNAQLMKVKVSHYEQIDKKSSFFSLHLRPVPLSSQNWTRFKFNGYTKQSQLGQYFSLTIGNKNGKNKLTRLYTSIWSMRVQNLQFMRINYPSLFGKMKIHVDQGDIQPSTEIKIQAEEVVTLIIKKYEKGQFTSRLLKQDYGDNNLILSKPMGAGLKYQQLSQEGKIVIVCGGTGILPFCDLIDLLFKRVKYLQKTNLSQTLKANDPLITSDIIQSREFSIFYACDILQDCPTLTFGQINYLCQSKFIKFSAIFRVKYVDINSFNLYSHIKFQKQYFIEKIHNLCQQKHRLNKIYICGPHKMNYAINQILISNHVHQQTSVFV